jgi:phosphinothricin acetyltransferase
MMRAMSCEITIRPARTDDAEAMADIYHPYVLTGTETFETVPPPPATFADKITQCAAKGWPFLVACAGEEVVGYAYTTQFRDRDAYRYACENSIYVKEGAHGRGIGGKLLAALLDAAKNAGFRQMIAVISGVGPASPALHAAHGFTEAGRMRSVGRKHGRWLDTLYMQRALGPGDTSPPDA